MKNPKLRTYVPVPAETEQVVKIALDSAFKVHTALGPGLLESVYESCKAHEIRKCGFKVDTQVVVPIVYDNIKIETGLRLDMLVEKLVIVEIKAAEQMIPLFESQLLTYLKITGLRLGLLINFNVPHLKNGIQRIVL